MFTPTGIDKSGVLFQDVKKYSSSHAVRSATNILVESCLRECSMSKVYI